MKNNMDESRIEDEKYMRRAIELAKGGEGWTNPNPLVGAVIVKDGVVIGEGFHHKYGDLHAERDALKNCKELGNDAAGATIYVTLEPCCHFGKQPPCTHAVVEAGIKRVVVGSRDPNPLVHGKGNAYLQENGVTVEVDFLREECDALNPIFFHYITTKMPFITLKYAMTMDGKIATKTGASKWITGKEARTYVQVLRNRYAGIMCGIGTVLADNPMLNCRMEGGSNPVRIICDSKLRIPLECSIVKTAKDIRTIVATTAVYFEDDDENDSKTESDGKIAKNNSKKSEMSFADKKAALEAAGVEVLLLSDDGQGHINLCELVAILGGEYKIDSILVEGGGELNYSALESGIVNKIYAFVAPKIFGGGVKAKSAVGGEGVEMPADSFEFKLKDVQQFGADLLLEYEKK